jgi:ribosomal protein S25
MLEITLMSISDRRTKKKRRWGKIFEYTSYERTLLVGDEYKTVLDEISAEFKKRKSVVITAQELAARRDIRVSVARRLLEDLEESKVLQKAFSNRRIAVYTKA